MKYFGMTDKGVSRAQNQDSFKIVQHNDSVLAVVCDGIGGHQAGDVASRLACDTLVKCFRRSYENNAERWYNRSLEKVNRVVFELANKEPRYKGMGPTMVSAVVGPDNKIYLLNVGDSRAYLLTKNDELEQITEDHSLFNQLVKKEGIAEDKAREMGQHVITRAIGIWPLVEGDIYEVDEDFKYLMLCSDGLHNYVEADKIIEVLNNSELTGRQKCETLVNMANEAGGYDNITVVLAEK